MEALAPEPGGADPHRPALVRILEGRPAGHDLGGGTLVPVVRRLPPLHRVGHPHLHQAVHTTDSGQPDLEGTEEEEPA
jgi:hypothetical protein